MWNIERPTQCASEIILSKRTVRLPKIIVEPVLSVKETVPQVVICGSVPLICARLRLKRKLPPRVASIFGRVARTLHTKLLESIYGDQGLCRSRSHAHIGAHAIHGVIV